MSSNFDSCDFDDFRKNFLIEKDLDDSSPFTMGELSKRLSVVNIDIGKTLTSWAKEVFNRVKTHVNRYNKKGSKISFRVIPAGDIKSGEAAILKMKIGKENIEVSIFDNNKMLINMSPRIANIVNKSKTRKFFSNRDKLSNYMIGILEVAHDI